MTMPETTKLQHTHVILNIDGHDYRFCDRCDTLCPTSEVDEIIDPIYGRSYGWQCQRCTERVAEGRLSGDV